MISCNIWLPVVIHRSKTRNNALDVFWGTETIIMPLSRQPQKKSFCPVSHSLAPTFMKIFFIMRLPYPVMCLIQSPIQWATFSCWNSWLQLLRFLQIFWIFTKKLHALRFLYIKLYKIKQLCYTAFWKCLILWRRLPNSTGFSGIWFREALRNDFIRNSFVGYWFSAFHSSSPFLLKR